MNTPSARSSPADSVLPGSGENTGLDSGLLDRSLAAEPLSRWMGWRLRLLVTAALLGCIAVLLLARTLADSPQLDASWRAGANQQLELGSTSDPALKPFEGQVLVGITAPERREMALDALALRRTSRWLIHDEEREQHALMQRGLAQALQSPTVELQFGGGASVDVQPAARGVAGLGVMFWLLCGLSLVLYLVAMVVMLARPTLRNLLYTIATLCQAGKLALIAVESSATLALPMALANSGMLAHAALDLLAAAAVVHAVALHPRRLPASAAIGWGVWGLVLGTIVALDGGHLRAAWWWVQGIVAALGVAAILLLSWSHRLEPHPFSIVMRRFAALALCAWLALTGSIAWTAQAPLLQQQIAVVGPALWSTFLGSLLVLLPFLSRSQQVMREFSLLAAISTIATALDLLFVAAFSLGQFASLTLALFLSLGLYSGARQWLLNQLRNQNVVTTERMFEKLYRIAREVEAHPERTSALLTQLLRDLYQPMEASVIEQHCSITRVSGNGSTLLIPLPALPHAEEQDGHTIVMRFAHHGRRLFTTEDARLADRVVEQLRRAVDFDRAVEQGRNEERLRIAQDLHDDIGARLLTLMYKAQSPEMEDYVRHTLQDLKTLTRGLAAPNHPLSHAAAEWKTDLTQRLTAAHMALGWNFSADRDLSLTVMQWSALTRVMRELVNNVISHSQARRVDIDFVLEGDRLDLSVTDNGVGRNPQAWAHGLGLGGVRKRVKQLGGEVEWREVDSGGICCRVCIRQLSDRL